MTSLRTPQVMALLQARHDPGSWAYFEEVANATGSNKTNSADALAMQLWPSRGLEMHGYEVKTSRTDWQKELANPRKAETFFKHCHRWWLVVGDVAIVKDGELPEPWGLMAPNKAGDKLLIVKAAPANEPIALSWHFLAGLLRSVASTSVPRSAVEGRIKEARQQGIEYGQKGYELHSVTRQRDDLKSAITNFEAAAGITITGWDAGNIGAAVKLLRESGIDGAERSVRYLLDQAERIVSTCQKALNTFANNSLDTSPEPVAAGPSRAMPS
jgi:hypothetical protein